MLRFLLLVCCFVALPAQAANRNATVKESNEHRVALVIGNSAYTHSPLANPVHDAEDMAEKLRSLGFQVIERKNLTKDQIGETLLEFRTKLSPGAVALVFYAGHGLQMKDENYLPAVDAKINSEFDVPNQSLSVRQIMEVLDTAKTRLNLVFLDACRNNPYASRSFRSTERGLARVSAPSGTLISYATRPGSVAEDGKGHNGLYTSKLLTQMNSSIQIELALKNVVREVKRESDGKQEPWMEGSIEGDFCFAGCNATPNTQVAQVAQVGHISPVAPIPAAPLVDADTELWAEVQAGNSIDDYQAYLDKYPKGKYATLARSRMKKLKAEAADKLKRENEAAVQAATDRARQERETAAQATADRARLQREEVAQAAAERIRQRQEAAQQEAARPAPVVQAARQTYEPEMVRIPNSNYEMGKYEVTQGQWKAVMGSNPSKFVDCGDTCPVEQVSWDVIQEFIQKLNAKTGRSYRLPSESEWQAACLAGNQTEYCGGNDLDAVAWYSDNSGSKTHPVGQKNSNAYGLYDMNGNVLEWTQNCWEGNCNSYVMRGGSWFLARQYYGATARHNSAFLFGGLNDRSGFRLARTLP